VTTFNERLADLRTDIVAQGDRVLDITLRAVESYFDGDRTKAAAVIALDEEIDRVDVEIERASIPLLAMGVTDVVRGRDLLDSAPRQMALWRALGEDAPRFWHVPMMLDARGQRLAKRDDARSLRSLRAAGWTPDQVKAAIL
jgi:hypothetical protein